jgi:hypothetical protein
VTPTPYHTHDIVYHQHGKYILRDKGFKEKTEKVQRKKLWHGNENMNSQERGNFYLSGSLEDHGHDTLR